MAYKILFSGSNTSQENYERAIAAVGGIPVSGYCPAVDTSYDGLLLCGGSDVDPSCFGQANQGSEGIDHDRDSAELALIKAYMALGKPILAICRGHQILNVALGGTLIQDLPADLRLFHRREETADKVHAVRAEESSFFGRTYGSLFHVNSAHHQAVDRLGEGLRPVLWSEGGVVEAMEYKTLPILCTQFHPERMSFENRRADTVDGAPVFQWFIKQCELGQ